MLKKDFYKMLIEKTTNNPRTVPINNDRLGVGARGSAVIDTRPAIAPFRAIVKSDLPNINFDIINAPMTPPAAAKLVFTNIIETAFASTTLEIINSDPPLKPNQPSHKIKVPSVASGKFAPGIAFTFPSDEYFPSLDPRTNTPANAAVAPQRWTTPDPAKSEKPAASRKPPPHFQ